MKMLLLNLQDFEEYGFYISVTTKICGCLTILLVKNNNLVTIFLIRSYFIFKIDQFVRFLKCVVHYSINISKIFIQLSSNFVKLQIIDLSPIRFSR